MPSSRGRSSDPRRMERPVTPPRPPPLHRGMPPGATPCVRPPAAPVAVSPRYREHRGATSAGESRGGDDATVAKRGRSQERDRDRKRRRDKNKKPSQDRDRRRRRRDVPQAPAASAAAPAASAAAADKEPPKTRSPRSRSDKESSTDSDGSNSEGGEKDRAKEKKQTLSVVPVVAETKEVRVAIAGRVDDLTARAMAFSRALVRGTQALRTAARIAREAAMSFESEMENFIQAQHDINRTFHIQEEQK